MNKVEQRKRYQKNTMNRKKAFQQERNTANPLSGWRQIKDTENLSVVKRV